MAEAASPAGAASPAPKAAEAPAAASPAPSTPAAKDQDALRKSTAAEEERALAAVLGTSSEAVASPATPPPAAASPAAPAVTAEQAEIDARSIYVGNVDYSTTPQELQLLFGSCGAVNRITIPCDRYTGSPKGFAYIEFVHADSVAKAVALNLTFKNRELKIVAKRSNVPGLSPHAARPPPAFRRRPWRGAPRRGARAQYHPYSGAGE